jgi:hypothetical protein
MNELERAAQLLWFCAVLLAMTVIAFIPTFPR